MATKIMPILAFTMLMTLYMADAIVITDWRITWLRNPIMRVAFTKYQSDQPVSHYFPYGPPKYYCHSNYAFYQLYICNAAQQGAHRTDGCLWNILNDFNGFHFFNAYNNHFATEIIDLTGPEIMAIKSGTFQICLLDATSMFMKSRNKRLHGYGIRCASPYECMRLPRFCWNVYHPALANAEAGYRKRKENLKRVELKNQANLKFIDEQNEKMKAMKKQIQGMETNLAKLLEMNQKNNQEMKSKNLEIMDLIIEVKRIKAKNVFEGVEKAKILEDETKKIKEKRQEILKNEKDIDQQKTKVDSEKEKMDKERALKEEEFARLMAEINSNINDGNIKQEEQNISINLVGNHNNLSVNNVNEQIAAVIKGQGTAKKDDAESSFDKAEEKETNADRNGASSWEKGKKLAANSLEKVWEHTARILTSERVTRVKDMGIEKAKKVNDVGMKFIANMSSKAKEHGFTMAKTVSKKSHEVIGEVGATTKDLALKGKEKVGRMIEGKYNKVKELIKTPSSDQQLVKEQVAQMEKSGRSPGVKHVLLGHAKYHNQGAGAKV